MNIFVFLATLWKLLFQNFSANSVCFSKHWCLFRPSLTLFDMGFFELSVMGGGGGGGGGHEAPHHNFVVIAPMIMKFGTGIKLDVFYTMVTKKFVTSLPLRNYNVITCILANV